MTSKFHRVKLGIAEDDLPAMNNFLFEMFLALRSVGVLCWDNEWEEWCFIEKWVWKDLDQSLKTHLVVYHEFNKKTIKK